VQNIEIHLTTKISCQVRHTRLLGQFFRSFGPGQTCLTSQHYPAPYPDFRDLNRTCPAPSPDMSSLSALSRVTTVLSGFLAGFQRSNPDMSSPQSRQVQPISLISAYHSLIRLLSWISETIVGHVQPPTRTCLCF
jgi:hypothetical protein